MQRSRSKVQGDPIDNVFGLQHLPEEPSIVMLVLHSLSVEDDAADVVVQVWNFHQSLTVAPERTQILAMLSI